MPDCSAAVSPCRSQYFGCAAADARGKLRAMRHLDQAFGVRANLLTMPSRVSLALTRPLVG